MHRTEGANSVTIDGKALYTAGPPATTVTGDSMNAIQEEIAHVIESAGIELLTAQTDTRTQLWQAFSAALLYYDYTVSSQETFNALFVRNGANNYEINGEYVSVYFKKGTYLMAGGTSPLSGGDTYGIIDTNNCTTLMAENGTAINFVTSMGYIDVTTDDCSLTNIEVTGTTGVTATMLARGFLITGNRTTFEHCSVHDRQTDSAFSAFDSSTASTIAQSTAKYNNCSIYDIIISAAALMIGFKNCFNVTNASLYQIDCGPGAISCFEACQNVTNIWCYDITSATTIAGGDMYGFIGCKNISNIILKKFDHTGATGGPDLVGFSLCERLSNCICEDFDSLNTGAVIGFETCTMVSNSKVVDFDSTTAGQINGFYTCTNLSACIADDLELGNANQCCGFRDCDMVSSSTVSNITGSGGQVFGFLTCENLSACYVYTIATTGAEAFGLYECKRISAITIDGVSTNNAGRGLYKTSILSACRVANVSGSTGYGFDNCSYGAALYTTEAANPNNSWMDTTDAQIVNKVSTPSVWT